MSSWKTKSKTLNTYQMNRFAILIVQIFFTMKSEQCAICCFAHMKQIIEILINSLVFLSLDTGMRLVLMLFSFCNCRFVLFRNDDILGILEQ